MKRTSSAKWSRKYINDLPDSSFAVIEKGGEKDEEGKTTPRSYRHLPYKDKDGEVDLPHLRNALARMNQIESESPEDSTERIRQKAKSVLTKVAKEHLPDSKFAKEKRSENKGRYKTTLLAKASISDLDADDVLAVASIPRAEGSSGIIDTDKDLMKIVSVLLSTGMNSNDDVFIRDEVLPARLSGANKPVDIEHDHRQIVGHMIATYVTSKDGEFISEDEIAEGSLPSDFDITNEAVIYKYLLPEVADKVLALASDNKLFVSVEAWFEDYDYLVGESIVKRTVETSSVLDELLRANGGEGKYKGHQVGRVLRNITIAGVGLTLNPANTDSVIRSIAASKRDCSSESLGDLLNNNIIGQLFASQKEENSMTKDLQSEFLLVLEGLKTAKKDLEEQKGAIEKLLEEAKQAREADKELAEKTIADLVSKNEGLEKANESLQGRVKELECVEMERNRKAIVASIKFPNPDYPKDKWEEWLSMSDEEFDADIADCRKMLCQSENNKPTEGGEAPEPTPEQSSEKAEEPKAEVPPTEGAPPVEEPAPKPDPAPEPAEAPVEEEAPKIEQKPAEAPQEPSEADPVSEPASQPEQPASEPQEPPKEAPKAPEPVEAPKPETPESPKADEPKEKETVAPKKTEEPKSKDDATPEKTDVEENSEDGGADEDVLDNVEDIVDKDIIPETNEGDGNQFDKLREVLVKILEKNRQGKKNRVL